MKIKSWRQIVALTVLAGTIGFFVYYFATHPEVREQLGATKPTTIALILALYIGTVGAIALITEATLRMCNKSLDNAEAVKLTAYSSLVNFFGPLQSGPAFRAVYLKKKHNINLKKYAAATMLYYLFFGILGVLFVASYWLDWGLSLIILAGLVVFYFLLKTKPVKKRIEGINMRGWYLLAIATLIQVIIMTAIYYVELKSLSPGISLQQVIIYSGAANLALFVSLTPGAIGFRESFLVFSQNLHGVDNETIIAASILDRTMYIILLSVLALGIFVTHTKQALTSDLSVKDS